MPRGPVDDMLSEHARRLRALEKHARDDRAARHASAATLAVTLTELAACVDALRQGTDLLEGRVDALQASIDLARAEYAAELAARERDPVWQAMRAEAAERAARAPVDDEQ